MADLPLRVARLTPEDAPRVVSVLTEAFADYPVMRFVLGEGALDHDARLGQLLHYFVMARVLRGEPLLGVEGEGGALAGAAIVSNPEGGAPPPALLDLRSELWRGLGAEAEARYEAYGAAARTFVVDEPHLHLNMIGVRVAFRGRGVARPLLEAVQELSRADPRSEGVTLTTESPRNVALYEHHGYRKIGHAQIAPTLESWGMYREDRWKGSHAHLGH